MQQEIILNNALEYLATISNLRKEDDDKGKVNSKLREINDFIRICLEKPDFKDYLNANLNLDLKVFYSLEEKDGTADKDLFKEILNRSHDEGNIFLSYDSDIYRKLELIDIKLTIYSKLLQKLAFKFIDNPHKSEIIMSETKKSIIEKKVNIEVLKDYKALGYLDIPPYRIWNGKKMKDIEKKSIEEELRKLQKEVKKIILQKRLLPKNHKEFIQKYQQEWWLEYKNYVTEIYPDIFKHFMYFNGVNIKVIISKSFLKLSNEFGQSGLFLCTGVVPGQDNGFSIEIDEYINEIVFLDDFFNNEDEIVNIDMGFELNTYKENYKQMISQNVEYEIRNELHNLFTIYLDETIFHIYSDSILKHLGIIISHNLNYKEGKMFDIHSKKLKHYKIIYFKKNEKMNFENIDMRLLTSEQYIVISSTVISKRIREKYIDKAIFLDINDLIQIGKEAKDLELERSVIYPYLKGVIMDKNIDLKYYTAKSLIKRLEECPHGNEGWKTYETICIDILKFVFKDSFRNFTLKFHSRNDNNLDIRDAIISNTGIHDFWKELRVSYSSKNIVFEFKNLTDEVGKSELLQVSNYLKKDSIGRVGVVFSRNGHSPNGREEQKELLNHDKKLIIILNDNDLIDLINKRLIDEEPEQLLEYLRFELEASV
ncbi:hypothetical protein SB775_25685 [Peribacillus sp. SIMBA_075]|uniref:hypothetical protein n=2 Tax=Bacillales TaxID=1385 RepID=UPI003979E757